MESYFEGGGKVKETSTAYKPDGKGAILKATVTTLNTQAKEYQPTLVSSQQQPFMQQQRQNAYWNVCEVEAILNDCTITKLSEDPSDLEALTPNRLLTMKGKLFLPPGLFEKEDLHIKRR